MKLSTRIIIGCVVCWVAGCAVFQIDLLPTLAGVSVIALLKFMLVDKKKH
jgi:hypothetical protein